jgi:hypothetical protein
MFFLKKNINYLQKLTLVDISYKSFFKKKIIKNISILIKLKFFFLLKKNNYFYFILENFYNKKFFISINLKYLILKKNIKKNIILKSPSRFKVAREKFQQIEYNLFSTFFFLNFFSFFNFFIFQNLDFSFFFLNFFFLKLNYFLEYFKFFNFFISFFFLFSSDILISINFFYKFKYCQLYFYSSLNLLNKLFFNFKISRLLFDINFLKLSFLNLKSNFNYYLEINNSVPLFFNFFKGRKVNFR